MSANPPIPELFKELSDKEKSTLAEALVARSYQAGQRVFKQGEEGDELIFIREGRVKVSKVSEEGRELLIAYLGAGDFFGELSILTGEHKSADIIAIDPLKVQVLSKESLSTLLGSIEISRAMMTALARRLHDSSERLADLVLYNVYRNVYETLRGLAERQLLDGVERLVIAQRPTHQEIAALLGSSREVITRTLKHLQRDGLIELSGRRVIIL